MSSCCDNPNIENSTHLDWCTNCGLAYSYDGGGAGSVSNQNGDINTSGGYSWSNHDENGKYIGGDE